MTTIIVVLIGIGVVFIASSLDCTPIKDTFTKIVSNQAIDWTGTQNCQQASTGNVSPPKANAPASIGSGTAGKLHNPNPDGSCTPPRVRVYVSGGKAMCQDP